MALETELATYQANIDSLKNHVGKFVLIQKDKVIATYSSYEDAIKAGYKEFGLEPFLVKQISTVEPVFYCSRPIRAVLAGG